MPEIDPEVHRHELVMLARRPHARRLGFPRRWHPECVTSDVTGMPFTPADVWHFIADRLEEGHPIEVIDMQDKPGTYGFVMLVEVRSCERPIYIKVQLGAGVIIGRSFHLSDVDDRG